ncbi:hypothetical protein FQR65_LT03422 [Abscondita terminalis]|nr:hypothetical protein FQR65_LT03422 [Abscondita terminalis]
MKEVSKDGFVIFGRDVTKVPCFRNSFLYGLSGGIGCGLLRFMFTSRPKSATDYAVGSFAAITMSYWFFCRYQYSQMKFEMNQMQYLLEQRALYEGTEDEKKLDVKMSEVVK